MAEDWLNEPPTPEELAEDESYLDSPPTTAELRDDQGHYPKDWDEGVGQAVLNKAANALSFGLSNKITAAGQAALDKAQGESDFGPAYDRRLRYQNERSESLRRQHPMPSNFAEALGYLGNPVARALPAGFFGQAAVGALDQGLNSKHNPVTETGEFLLDTGLGGVVGGTVGKAAELVGKALNPSELRQAASEAVVKASTGRNKRALKALARGRGISDYNKGINQAGSHMFDEGIVEYGDTTASLAPKLEAAARKYGAKIGETGEAVDKLGVTVSGKKIGDEILDYATKIPENLRGKALQNRMLDEAQDMASKGEIPFYTAQGLKNNTKYKVLDSDALVSNEDASNAIKGIIGRNMEEAAERAAAQGGPTAELLRQYKDSKARYGTFSGLGKASTDRVVADQANRNITPSTYAVTAATTMADAAANPGHAVKSAIKGIAAGYLHSEGRNKGKTAVGLTLNRIANALESAPFLAKYGRTLADAAGRGPAALLLTHRLLSKDPEYAAAVPEDPMEQGDAEYLMDKYKQQRGER